MLGKGVIVSALASFRRGTLPDQTMVGGEKALV